MPRAVAPSPPPLPDGAVHVVGAAILRRGRCLVARRAAHVASPGLWEFPGGKVEDGEPPATALAREIREELALDVEVGPWLGRGEARPGGRHVVLDVYRATLVAGEPTLTDHDRVDWIGAGDVRGLDWAAADLPILDALLSLLRGESR